MIDIIGDLANSHWLTFIVKLASLKVCDINNICYPGTYDKCFNGGKQNYKGPKYKRIKFSAVYLKRLIYDTG